MEGSIGLLGHYNKIVRSFTVGAHTQCKSSKEIFQASLTSLDASIQVVVSNLFYIIMDV